LRTYWKAGVGVAALSIAALASAPFLYARLETARLWHDVIGVDVSNHQGAIDWTSLTASGVAFAYIKATEGSSFRDKRFQQNWNDAKAAGMLRGAYHFLTQCRSGADQAANFIRTVPREAGALPPAVDAEHMGPCAPGRSVADIRGEMLVFMNLVEAHYGKRPVVYVTREFHQAYLDGYLNTESFWVRSLFLPPSIREQSWLFWQFHHRGLRPGINGSVDLDAFRGSTNDLAAIAR
jgi:lysozyme